MLMTRATATGLIVFCAAVATSTPALAQPACTRADLQSAVDGYLAAQRSGNPAALPLAASAKYIENTQSSLIDKGIVKSPLKIDFSRSLLDATICETFTEVIVTDKSHPYVLGVRLKVASQKIAELETLVTDADDWLFNADTYLKYSSAENWGVVPAASRDSRETLIAAANAYFEVFNDNTVKVPWGTPCNRLEGGIRTGRGQPDDSCNVGVPSGMKLTERRFIADPEIGAVVGFIRWPTGVPDSHLFRVESGTLRFVHSLTVCTVPNCGFATRPPGNTK
ncbi:MAG TPA: hypothetical protein VFV95_10380 [Vicinamibacterales bacterium]|nr:hypothetical protein [Vicinamibacterales bacterium]